MRHAFSRVVVLALALGASLASGCNTSNEIPLVKFPDNMPAPVAPKADNVKGPQGANTSQGDPRDYSK